MPTVVTVLVGKIGAGKTTGIGWKAGETHQTRPLFPQVSNLPIKFLEGECLLNTKATYEETLRSPVYEHRANCECPSVHYQEDILKWLALKLIKRDITPMELYVDEAAQAGLESRGSGLKSTDSRLITLARKANVHLFLASQLMSMMDKRAQWNWDFAWDCNAHFITEESMSRFIPDYFSYDVYDADFRYQKTIDLFNRDFEPYVFPLFDTMQVPLRTLLEQEFKMYYWSDGKKGFNQEAYEADSQSFDEFIETIKSRQMGRMVA